MTAPGTPGAGRGLMTLTHDLDSITATLDPLGVDAVARHVAQ